MPPVNVLIKPASSTCNMDCTYCFYRDVSDNREVSCSGIMSPETMEKIIVAAMDYAEHTCTFSFQGGEPTLAGLDFYRQVIALEQKHGRPGVAVYNTIQTNGYQLDEEWAAFFAQQHFLVGLSLDGPAELHDLNRKDMEGKATFHHILQTAALFDRFHVEYNVLCVVTGRNARSIHSIYDFYGTHGFQWLQFIPCLEPLGQERGKEDYHLSCEEYGDFLLCIFDLWFQDLKNGKYTSIRHLDNWMRILLGEPAEACSMVGHCSIQFVIEGDGSVYPCDFYVLDQWKLGVVGQTSFAEMAQGPTAMQFLRTSGNIPTACQGCEVYPICRNGCRRDRIVTPDGLVDQNYFCKAYKCFFSQRRNEIGQAVQRILQMRRDNG